MLWDDDAAEMQKSHQFSILIAYGTVISTVWNVLECTFWGKQNSGYRPWSAFRGDKVDVAWRIVAHRGVGVVSQGVCKISENDLRA